MPAITGMPVNANTAQSSAPGLSTLDTSKMVMSDKDIQLELDKIFHALTLLKERGSENGAGSKIAAIQEALKSATSSQKTNNAAIHLPANCENGPKRPSVHLVNGQVVNGENHAPHSHSDGSGQEKMGSSKAEIY